MKKNRKVYLSVMNAVSCFAVVAMHANTRFWTFSATERYWLTANLIECIMFFAVPVFFMISGATLIDYRDKYTTSVFFQKRIQKTVIPFLIWSIIGAIYCWWQTPDLFSNLQGNWIFWFIRKILNTEFVTIYWFFIPLFSIYLCIPVLSAVSKEKREEVFRYAAAVSFLINSLIPFLCRLSGKDFSLKLTFPVCGEYLIYILLGYLLSKRKLLPVQRTVIYLLALAGLIMHTAGTYFYSTAAGELVRTFKGYTNVPCLLYSTGIFVFLKELSEWIHSEKVLKFLDFFSSYTFSVYLLHWFVLDLMTKYLHLNNYSILYRVGMPFVVIPACIGLTVLIRKIPGGRYIVP
ncbi:MAG: acyltransferase [Lachnospiraceae bacterium]